MGREVSLGNGTDEKDIYKIQQQDNYYILNYYNKQSDTIELWRVEINEDNKSSVWEELKKDGSTITDIINSKEKLNIILNSNKAVNEMIASEEIRNEIINSEIAIKTISENSDAMNKIINNNIWIQEILNNKNAIEYLKKSNNYTKVATLTGNTTNVIKSSCYGDESIWGAWKCFDGKIGNGEEALHWSSHGNVNEYIGYTFNVLNCSFLAMVEMNK